MGKKVKPNYKRPQYEKPKGEPTPPVKKPAKKPRPHGGTMNWK